MKCPSCSNETPSNSSFCQVCGETIHQQEVDSQESVSFSSEQHVTGQEPQAAPFVSVNTDAVKQTGRQFLGKLRFRDANPPDEISDSIFWINWFRRILVVAFWIVFVLLCLGCILALLAGIYSGTEMMSYDAGYGFGAILGTIIGTIIVFLLGLFFLMTSTALNMFLLNWARDTAYIRAKIDSSD